jgi:hypothetical protein
MAKTVGTFWLLLGFISLALARNLNSTESHQQSDPLQCQTARAPDYYGLGVRLGIYFQWGSAYVANTMLPSEIAGALDANSIFLFSLLIAMVKCTLTNMLESVDGVRWPHPVDRVHY